MNATERVVTALRLARRRQGTTVREVMKATEQSRAGAWKLLSQLVDLGELTVDESKHRHVYTQRMR